MKFSVILVFVFYTLNIYALTHSKTIKYVFYFKNNSFKLSDESKLEIQLLTQRMIEDDSNFYSIDIIGYTDSVGSYEHNVKLSENRAKAVYDEFLSKANTNKGIQQTIDPAFLTSICYSYPDPNINTKRTVNIDYKGNGVDPNEDESDKLELQRKAIVSIRILTPIEHPSENDIIVPKTDSTINFINGTRLILEEGAIKNINYCSRLSDSYDSSNLYFKIFYKPIRDNDIFKQIIELDDHLLIILGKAIVDSFSIQTYRSRSAILDFKNINLQIPTFTDDSVKLNLYINQILKTQEVYNSQKKFLETSISDNFVIKKNYKNQKENLVTINVIRDTIYLVKQILKSEINNITIQKRGQKKSNFSIKYPFLDHPINLEFKRVKNFLLFFKKYEANIVLYGNGSDVNIWVNKTNSKIEKIKLNNYKTNQNKYLIK